MAEGKNYLSKLVKSEYLFIIILLIAMVFIVSIVGRQRMLYQNLASRINSSEDEEKDLAASKPGPESVNQSESAEISEALPIKSLTPLSFSGQSQMLSIETDKDSECLYSDDKTHSNPKAFSKKAEKDGRYVHSSEIMLPAGYYSYYLMCFSAEDSSEKMMRFAVYEDGKPPKPVAGEAQAKKPGLSFYLGILAIALIAVDLAFLAFRAYRRTYLSKPLRKQERQKEKIPYFSPSARNSRYAKNVNIPLKQKPKSKANADILNARAKKTFDAAEKEGYIELSEMTRRLRKIRAPRSETLEKLKRIAGRK